MQLEGSRRKRNNEPETRNRHTGAIWKRISGFEERSAQKRSGKKKRKGEGAGTICLSPGKGTERPKKIEDAAQFPRKDLRNCSRSFEKNQIEMPRGTFRHRMGERVPAAREVKREKGETVVTRGPLPTPEGSQSSFWLGLAMRFRVGDGSPN